MDQASGVVPAYLLSDLGCWLRLVASTRKHSVKRCADSCAFDPRTSNLSRTHATSTCCGTAAIRDGGPQYLVPPIGWDGDGSLKPVVCRARSLSAQPISSWRIHSLEKDPNPAAYGGVLHSEGVGLPSDLYSAP